MRTRSSRLAGLGVFAITLVTTSLLHASAGPGPKIDPSWVQIDSSKKEVTLSLFAALGGDNSGMNFNGTHEGGLTFTVPVGWTVNLNFTNKDGGQGHGVDIVPYQLPVLDGIVPSAIPGAATDTAGIGLPPGSKKALRFTATPAGKYILRCSVSGHPMMGMWMVFVVSKDATLPTLDLTSAKH
jgi:sulfocyanin